MIGGRYDVRLNGISLNDFGEDVIITDIVEDQPSEVETVQSMAYANRSYYAGRVRDGLSVTVTFAIRAYGIIQRTDIYGRIAKWASKPGFLEINDRTGQRLYIDAAKLPSVGSVRNWTDTISIQFMAYSKPFWEGCFTAMASQATATTATTMALFAPGNAESCVLDAKITATTAITSLTISCGNDKFVIAASVQPGQVLEISHTDEGYLRITANGQSVLASRSADSADEIRLVPGASNAVGITANGQFTATISTRGAWQ